LFKVAASCFTEYDMPTGLPKTIDIGHRRKGKYDEN